MAELSYAQVSALLKYDSETGKLYWLERPVEMCASQGSAVTWNKRFAGKECFLSIDGKGYFCGSIFDKQYSAARIAWLLHTGEWPKNCIDHINGNPLDNRISNLRDVSRLENQRNRKRFSTNTSGVCGVVKDKDKWRAHITVNGALKSLGLFSDISEAAAARSAAEIEYGYHPNHGRD